VRHQDLASALPSSLIAAAMNLYLQLLLLTVSGWVNRHQQSVIEYLRAENHALREQLGPKRIRWTDAQRRMLAEKARAAGRARSGFGTGRLRPFGLVRYFVFFVIDIGSRRVHIAGISNQPSGAWMTQIARNLTDYFDGFLRGTRHMILDRDPLYTRAFRSTLAESGVNIVRLPARSPDLNAFAERFVLSMKSECLDRVIPLGERHLRHLLAEYVEHYHTERNHQSLGNELNELIEPVPANTNAGEGVVLRRARLGGMLSYYHREAA